MAKLTLDFGHGGIDSGAVANGRKEKDMNLEVGLKLMSKLKKYPTIQVNAIRTTDKTVELSDRPAIANKWGADLYLSIHHNAGKGIGYDAIYSIIGGASKTFATDIAAQYDATGQKRHGLYSKKGSDGHDYYCVIRETKMAAVISEFCFVDSNDIKNYNADKEATALEKAICVYYKIAYKPDTVSAPKPAPKPTTPAGTLYTVQTGAFGNKDNAEKLAAELEKKGYDILSIYV
jgi:N-acetylmuramoyl-L-alanine amidase